MNLLLTFRTTVLAPRRATLLGMALSVLICHYATPSRQVRNQLTPTFGTMRDPTTSPCRINCSFHQAITRQQAIRWSSACTVRAK